MSGETWQELEWGKLGLECESSLGHFPLQSGEPFKGLHQEGNARCLERKKTKTKTIMAIWVIN